MTVTLDHVMRSVDGIPAIRDVALTLERGTLSVLVNGRNVTGCDLRKRSVAMVYQPFIDCRCRS